MELNAKLRFSTKKHSWLCFRHAVILSFQGKDVELDISDYNSEYYGGPTWCKLCADELDQNVQIGRLDRHYSGCKSTEFWDIIHKVDKGKLHSEKFQHLYRLGAQLQNLETEILTILAEEES